MNYSKNLKFEDKPDYILLKGLFKVIYPIKQKEAMNRTGSEIDYKYDWVKGSE